MAVVVFFSDAGSKDSYEVATRIIKADASWKPAELRYHVAYQTDQGVKVLEVWDSIEALENYSVTLTPLLEQAGVPAAETAPPVIYDVVNLESD